MDLETNRSGDSFYESFSDLIFATMAIFVLLMLVFLIQMAVSAEAAEAAPERIASLEEELNEVLADATEAETQLEQAQQQLHESEQEREKLEDIVQVHPVELVIVVDVSGSMAPTADNLRQAIRQIAMLVPKLSKEVRLGIVVYQTGNHRFPESGSKLYVIQDRSNDGGASFQILDQWMSKWLDLTGPKSKVSSLGPPQVDIRSAVSTGLSMFSSTQDRQVRQVFVVMGDTGPWERGSSGGDWVIQSSERTIARKITSMVREWSRQSDNRYVVTHYAKINNTAILNRSDVPNEHKSRLRSILSESISFFQGLATSSNKGDRYYSEAWEHVMVQVLDAMLQKEL